MRTKHRQFFFLKFLSVAIGCSSPQDERVPVPDCSWSDVCAKRTIKTTYFDAHTIVVDVTYYDKQDRLVQEMKNYGSEYSGATRYEYNKEGNLSKEIGLDADGNEESVMDYRYDNGHRLVSVKSSDYRDDTNSTVDYLYDNNYTMTKRTDNGDDGKYDEFIYFTYDHSWHMIKKEVDFEADGTINRMVRYDAHGYEIERWSDCCHDDIFTCEFKAENTYDSQEHLIKINVDYNHDGEYDAFMEITYDSKGRMVALISGFADNVEVIKFQYDIRGRLIKITETNEGKKARKSIRNAQYDEEKNTLTIMEDKDGDGTVDDTTWCTWQVNLYNGEHEDTPSYLHDRTWTGKKGCDVQDSRDTLLM